ncbi:MAG: hypothetical protein ACLSCF_07780 [Alistipes finegoldii]
MSMIMGVKRRRVISPEAPRSARMKQMPPLILTTISPSLSSLMS